jgi:SAM-dependent methyltransferase
MSQDQAEVITEISPNDRMYSTAPEHYAWWGGEAIWCIELALRAARKQEVDRILDLPCGHGRVLRRLRATWPAAEITACDIDEDAVSFCATTFGATPVVATSRPQDMTLDGPFDLIWCGSLFTHLDHPRWGDLLDRFASVLDRDGILVFTTHGAAIADELRVGEMRFTVPRRTDLVARYDHDGFGYYDYAGRDGYGISLSSAAWVAELLDGCDGLRHHLSVVGGWGKLQDLHTCTRRWP